MRIFVKYSYIPYKIVVAVSAVVLGFCIIVWSKGVLSPILIGLELLVLILLSLAWLKHLNSFGLYIKGENVYYKGYRTRKIDPSQVGAIQIAKSVSKGRAVPVPYKDRYGNQLYTMILLVRDDLWRQIGDDEEIDDATFKVRYRDYVICSVVYNKEAVDYLLTLNPHIEVLPLPSDLEPQTKT